MFNCIIVTFINVYGFTGKFSYKDKQKIKRYGYRSKHITMYGLDYKQAKRQAAYILKIQEFNY